MYTLYNRRTGELGETFDHYLDAFYAAREAGPEWTVRSNV
jgi:hypothetical protein